MSNQETKLSPYEEKILRKQTARKGFVIDVVNNELTKSFIFTRQNIANIRAEMECYIEILEKVVVDKLGITQTTLDNIKNEIHIRNTKDNSLINKYWGDQTKPETEKLELMKNEGLSDKAYSEIKQNIEKKNQKRLPLDASTDQETSQSSSSSS